MQLDASAAQDLLAAAPVVRLATVDGGGRPHIVVTTFAVAGGHIYTAVDQKPKSTRELKRLQNIRSNPAVSVLADHYADDWDRLWWARADGNAVVVTQPEDMARAIRLLAERYPQYRADPPHGPVIDITVTRWSGWAYSDGTGTSIT